MSGGELTAGQIRALLHELGRRLQARGNRPTADIYASYADPATVNAIVTEWQLISILHRIG